MFEDRLSEGGTFRQHHGTMDGRQDQLSQIGMHGFQIDAMLFDLLHKECGQYAETPNSPPFHPFSAESRFMVSSTCRRPSEPSASAGVGTITMSLAHRMRS
jgi:hypothetical protein